MADKIIGRGKPAKTVTASKADKTKTIPTASQRAQSRANANAQREAYLSGQTDLYKRNNPQDYSNNFGSTRADRQQKMNDFKSFAPYFNKENASAKKSSDRAARMKAASAQYNKIATERKK